MTVKKSIQNQLVTARESLGCDIKYVQSVTGISTVVIEGFEVGNFDVVEPVFTRLALRTYADFLGLDVKVLISELDTVLGEKDKSNIENLPKYEKSRDSVVSFPFFRVFVVFSILVAVFFFFIAFLDTDEQNYSSTTVVITTDGDIANPIEINNSSLEIDKIEDDRISSIKETDSDLFATPKLVKEESISSVAVKMTEPTQTESTYSLGNQGEGSVRSEFIPKIALKVDSTSKSSTAHVAMGISQPQNVESLKFSMNAVSEVVEATPQNRSYPDSLSLVLIAVDTTWVRVEWDNSSFYESLMLPEQQKYLSAADSFFVHAGKPHGVIYYLNGDLLTRGEIGEPNRVLRFRADTNGVTILDSKFKPLRTFVKP
ncbi:MAG: helix-turn-helix transcriptional regulator [Candidatus Latescibacterota bacterium]|nr:helix-turn-helix transcriptional regulator [Candidatus Latescibacterota bacterium]